MPLAISSKTRKMLWARSGNQCAICQQGLILQAVGDVDASVVGDECHIVADSPAGPRGGRRDLAPDIDGYDNLILLCRNHHKLIDDRTAYYSVARLQRVKQLHEKTIRERLARRRVGVPLFVLSMVVICGMIVVVTFPRPIIYSGVSVARSGEDMLLAGKLRQMLEAMSETGYVSEIKSAEVLTDRYGHDRQLDSVFIFSPPGADIRINARCRAGRLTLLDVDAMRNLKDAFPDRNTFWLVTDSEPDAEVFRSLRSSGIAVYTLDKIKATFDQLRAEWVQNGSRTRIKSMKFQYDERGMVQRTARYSIPAEMTLPQPEYFDSTQYSK
jgi:hypothetical protein